MANQEKLPWDLTEEILSCVPPQSLVRFRAVSKQWNALLSDKAFIKKHKTKMTYRFILATKSKIYSVSVNPEIEVRDLTLDNPALESDQLRPRRLMDCDGLLLCDMDKRATVSNPWLRQTRWVEHEGDHRSLQFSGIGYDDNNGYKTLGTHRTELDPTTTFWKTLDFSSDAWKEQRGVMWSSGTSTITEEGLRVTFHSTCGVSLNGTWYRVASYNNETKYSYFIVNFDFTKETFNQFCDLPCKDNKENDALVLRVFMGDRFSLLKQSNLTKKIQIWVTKNKIHKLNGRYVEWMNFMEVSIPNFPDLVQPSYFINDKRLVVCSWAKDDGRAWIYVVGDNKLISKTKIDLVLDQWPSHCSFIPSLVSVPGGKEKTQND
ncbi:F-box domain-containing protein [Hirschfeldia incana]|nr:F-box domain-containing protein [Hirschfeldia incana]